MSVPVGAIISGASTLLSGGLDLFGSKAAAKSQLQGVRETNETNYKIAQENNAFNAAQIDKMNEYNSAVNQRKRLEEAGLNPYLMLDGGSAGTASSAATADENGKSVAPDIGNTIASGYQAFGNSIQSAASQIAQQSFQQKLQDAQVSKVRNEAVHQGIENEFAAAMFVQDLRQKMLHNKISKVDYDYLHDSLKDRINQVRAQNNLMYSQQYANERQGEKSFVEIGLLNTQKSIADENLKWLPREKQASFSATLQNTLTSASQMRLNNAQARQAVSMAALNWAMENGVRIDNYVKDSVSDLSIGLVENNYNKGYAEADQYSRGLNLNSTSLAAAYLTQDAANKRKLPPKRAAHKSNINIKPKK